MVVDLRHSLKKMFWLEDDLITVLIDAKSTKVFSELAFDKTIKSFGQR